MDALFHIDYIQSKLELNPIELRALARVLGFPSGVLSSIFNCRDTNVTVRQIFEDIYSEVFYIALNQTYNRYSSQWNGKVMLTSIFLLNHRTLKFSDLFTIRCVFNLYESDDGKGMQLNVKLLLRLFKMCNRLISPMKLKHRIKHMHNRLYIPGRLQLWEILELVIWSDAYDYIREKIASQKKLTIDKTNGIYELDSIEIVHTNLSEYHDKNCEFILEEMTFLAGNYRKMLRLIDQPIKSQNQSMCRIEQKKFLRFDPQQKTLNIQRKEMSHQNISFYSLNTDRVTTASLDKHNYSQNENQKKIRPKTAPIVSTEEMEDVKNKIKECQKNTEYLPEKFKIAMYRDLEYLMPGFWTRWNNRPKSYNSKCTHVNLDPKRIPCIEHIQRLAKPSSKLSTDFHKLCF